MAEWLSVRGKMSLPLGKKERKSVWAQEILWDWGWEAWSDECNILCEKLIKKVSQIGMLSLQVTEYPTKSCLNK